jgi:hypothetical protein
MAIERCNECGNLIDAVPGDFYCPGGVCRARYHRRLLGQDQLETRRAAPPARRPGFSVTSGWQAIGAAAESNYHEAVSRNR